jgi:hypothetical protein
MAIQEFAPVVRGIMYDGTNSAEIIPYFGADPTVSEIDGVWEVNDGVRDPITVYAGDWYMFDAYFQTASAVTQNYFLLQSLPAARGLHT